MYPLENPYKTYSDSDGNPLDSGFIYFGVANQNPITSPVTVYWDAAGTQPALQPIRTINGYPVRHGTPAIVYYDGSYSQIVLDSKGRQVFFARNSAEFSIVTIVINFLATLATSIGSSLIGFIQEGTGAVLRTLQSKNRDESHLFDFLTSAQQADYLARTAQTNFAGALDLTAAIQQAIYTTYAQGKNLKIPGGAAKVTGTLELPTNTALYEDRGDAWTMDGQGAAQTFVRTGYKGAVFISQTDLPILRYRQRRVTPTSGANWVVTGIRFEQQLATAVNPVVVFDSLCEYACFHHNQVYQAGVGDGIKCDYQIKGEIHHNFVMNRDWATFPGARVGIGINIPSAADAGLLTLRKNSSRGFLWGYVLGDGVNDMSGCLIEQNECSYVTNGVWIKALNTACTLFKPYFEAVSGTCVKDDGVMSTVDGGVFYTGFSIGIDSSSFTYGNRYVGNYIETAGVIPCTLIKIGSSGAPGGQNKSIEGNHLLFSTSGGVVPGVVGVEISGAGPRVNLIGNAFLPRGLWVGGAGTIKISDLSTVNGVQGICIATNGDDEFPLLSNGAVSLGRATNSITQADVAANVLTVPPGSFFTVAATGAATAQQINGGELSGRLMVFNVTNTNLLFQDTALLKLNGNFSGPGTLTLITQNLGGSKFAYEIARTIY
ncbi:MAG: hypothetical protein V4857_14240 [Pseudomonadota bacterium]